jgi:hypothetical protein
MTPEQELENLKAAVRKYSHDPRLLRLVGPDEFEQGQVEIRLKKIAELMPLCDWGNNNPSITALSARDLWGHLNRRQGAYERNYL